MGKDIKRKKKTHCVTLVNPNQQYGARRRIRKPAAWNTSGPHGEGDVKLRAAVRYVISIDHIIHFIHSIYTISLGEVIRIESKVDGRVRG
jgi:hypothetical protein